MGTVKEEVVVAARELANSFTSFGSASDLAALCSHAVTRYLGFVLEQDTSAIGKSIEL